MARKKRPTRYTEGFGLTGPEKVRVQEFGKFKFRLLVFVSIMGVLLGWACHR